MNLINSHPVTVAYRDGRTETLALRELSIRELYRWIEHHAARDTPALVALCAGQKPDWVDTLSDDSFGDLARRSFDLNFHRATALALKDPTVAALLSSALLQIAQLADGLPLSVKSPAPAASDSAAATGSESST